MFRSPPPSKESYNRSAIHRLGCGPRGERVLPLVAHIRLCLGWLDFHCRIYWGVATVQSPCYLCFFGSQPNRGCHFNLCQYIINEVKRQGVNVMTNDEVYSLAIHYFDGDCTAAEIGKPINCKVVVSKPELSEEDKADLKAQAMEQHKQEQLQAIRREATAKATSKPKTSAPKAGAEIETQPNLFDF